MEQKEKVILTEGGKYWEHRFEKFTAKVFVPDCELPTEVINYGFQAPYLMVFEENPLSIGEAVKFAKETGLSEIAKGFGGSVVFLYPTAEGGWDNAPSDLFASVISESKIAQYYEDGMIKLKNRFTGEIQGYFIRGAVLRTCLYGFGKSADYIAKNCLKTIEGDGLYGKGDITPVVCILNGLNVTPNPERADIPVVSVGNSDEINAALKEKVSHLLIEKTAEYQKDYREFIGQFRRMMGHLEKEQDLSAISLHREEGFETITTSPDNCGDDRDTKEHKIGYVVYCNEKLLKEGKKLPTVLCFHGGGDSALIMANLSGWFMVANKYDFLLVCVEHHMNSTAAETVELLSKLKAKYPIDEERVYASGFSMGGCKSWDLYQEYPELFAGVAPMDATFDVGCNVFGKPAPKVNRDVCVPVFYAGGENTPLPELPFQAQKCVDRMAYVFEVNQVKTSYDVCFDKQDDWKNKIFGIDGDRVVVRESFEVPGRLHTMNLFYSKNGNCYTVFSVVGKQQHEVHHHTCENAYRFLRNFRRLKDGTLLGGEKEIIDNAF